MEVKKADENETPHLRVKGEKEEAERKFLESMKEVEKLRRKVQASLTFQEGLQIELVVEWENLATVFFICEGGELKAFLEGV